MYGLILSDIAEMMPTKIRRWIPKNLILMGLIPRAFYRR